MQDLKTENILKVVYNNPTTKEEKELALKEYVDLIWKINDLTKQVKELSIPRVVSSAENIEVAIKHFLKRQEDFSNRLSGDEVLKVLRFLKQADTQALKIIGMGYTRYDGGNIKEVSSDNMYEGGFIVQK